MSINVNSLKEQLIATEAELESAKAHLYRCDGVVQMLKHLIASWSEVTVENNSPDSPSDNPA